MSEAMARIPQVVGQPNGVPRPNGICCAESAVLAEVCVAGNVQQCSPLFRLCCLASVHLGRPAPHTSRSPRGRHASSTRTLTQDSGTRCTRQTFFWQTTATARATTGRSRLRPRLPTRSPATRAAPLAIFSRHPITAASLHPSPARWWRASGPCLRR